jgi:hypothetical protein
MSSLDQNLKGRKKFQRFFYSVKLIQEIPIFTHNKRKRDSASPKKLLNSDLTGLVTKYTYPASLRSKKKKIISN